MNIFKLLKNSVGFTLIEAMIAASVIGVISMVVINQVELANKSRIISSSNTVVNSLRDRLIIALSNEQTCTANFAGDPIPNIAAPLVHTEIKDSENIDIINTTAAFGVDVAPAVKSETNTESVRIASIHTYQNAANANEMILRVRFQKKSSNITNVFTGTDEFTMPLNVIKNGVNVGRCFSDATFSIATAIRLSCKGNTSFYNPNRNIPFGQCEHMFSQPRALPAATPPRPAYPNGCPAGFFMRRIGVNLYGAAANTTDSKTIQYECTPLKSECPAGQVLKATNIDGTVTCGHPLPTCAPGQLMVMSAAGNFICLSTNIGCSGLYAIKSFDANGMPTCAQFYPGTCAGQFITSITPGTISCNANVQAISCPFGSFVKSFNAAGTPTCSPWLAFGSTCAPGFGARGLNTNGTLNCQRLDKFLTCGGAKSPTNTFRDCEAVGGTVVSRTVLGSTNSYCRITFIPGAPAFKTCANVGAGWSTCSNLKTTVDNTCGDTNSACAHSNMPAVFRTALGTYVFNNAGVASTQCLHWARNSGPWVRSCTLQTIAAPTYAYVTELGCY